MTIQLADPSESDLTLLLTALCAWVLISYRLLARKNSDPPEAEGVAPADGIIIVRNKLLVIGGIGIAIALLASAVKLYRTRTFVGVTIENEYLDLQFPWPRGKVRIPTQEVKGIYLYHKWSHVPFQVTISTSQNTYRSLWFDDPKGKRLQVYNAVKAAIKPAPK